MHPIALTEVTVPPISELLSLLLVQIAEIVHVSRDVLIEKESFAQLSSFLSKVSPILAELQLKVIRDSPTFRTTLEALARELKNAKDVVDTCRTKSKFYLFINCRSVIQKMQQITAEVSKTLSVMPLAHLELSRDCEERIMYILQETQDFEFKTTLIADEVVGKIEMGLQEHKENSNFSNELLMQIAKAVGVELCPALLKTELEQLNKDKENAELHKNKAEALQLEQIAGLLSWADLACSLDEREKVYRAKRVSLGSQPFPSLQSFSCPITQDIMEDPVDIVSGHTFERAAIQKWFAEGHTICPITFLVIENFELKPNAVLRRSINEWKERNTMIQLTTMRTKLASENEEVVLAALEELCGMCELRLIHRHWIAAEGLVPALVYLLRSSKSSIRKNTLSTLNMAVKGKIELKDRACEVGVAALAVRSLARELSESRLAVALLLELSNEQKLCKQLSTIHGCIFLLVAMTNCEGEQAAEDAKAVLKNLSKITEQNAVFMAEANYFGPLLQHMNEGAETTKMIMANALSQFELTDESRRVLVQMGVLPSLLRMLSEGNLEMKLAALGALQNLSVCSENRNVMVKAGVMKLVLALLFTKNSVLFTIKEQAAVVFANLASSSSLSYECINDLLGTDPKSTIYKLLSLLNLSGHLIQSQILKALFGMSCPPCSKALRMTIMEAGAVELLVSMYLVNTNMDVRIHSLKFLRLLSQGGGGEALAKEIGLDVVQSLVNLLVNSSDEDTKTLVLGLLFNIPVDNSSITGMLVKAGLLPVLRTILLTTFDNVAVKKELLENAVGLLLRFTLSSNVPLQQKVVADGVIPVLLHLLRSGTPLTKSRSAMSLTQLSESTWKLTCRTKKATRFWCLMPQVKDVCRVHGGVCTIEKSFCLVQGQAVSLLIQELVEPESVVVGSALGALATLLYDEFWDRGADVLAEAGGVAPIIRLLTTSNAEVLEATLWILERIFRKERYRTKYGNTAQMALVSLTQDGTSKARHMAARILAHLHILQELSSYF